MSIKDCIFVTESFAHLNGREKELLPKVEAARAEHAALLQAKASHDLWLKKTEWVADAQLAGELPDKYLGHHRADVMQMEIEQLRAELRDWRNVFGHLGTPDEVGNLWHKLSDEADALRAEIEALKKVARLASELTCCMNEDKDGGYFLCEEAAPVLDDLMDTLGELR